jgi:peptidoglycan hydrolase-like protein with peptidoglycan-binding domain
MSCARRATPTPQGSPANTAQVQRGKLSAMVSLGGTLTYRARSDGSPYSVINRARGVYTKLPASGDRVDCGGVVYRVDDRPVLLLCGTVAAYRALHVGDAGQDVRQLNRNLHQLGYADDARVHIDPGDNDFTSKTKQALKVLQRRKGVRATGTLATGDAVFLSESVRISEVTGDLGGFARPGAPVLTPPPASCTCRWPLIRRSGVRSEGRPRPDHPAGQHAGVRQSRRVRKSRAGLGWTRRQVLRRDHPDIHQPRRSGEGTRA